MNFKILTFNWHEPYLCLLAKLGYSYYVLEPEIAQGKSRLWDTRMRSLTENMELISRDKARDLIDEGFFDLAIAHNVKDLCFLGGAELPKIMVFHNHLSTELALAGNPMPREEYLETIQPLLKDVGLVFISESKRQDWGLQGKVIIPGLDVDEFEPYKGEGAIALRVGNLLKERDLMLGYEESERLLKNFHSITLGLNPQISASRLSRSYDDLKSHYKYCRLFVNTTKEPFEDGYNLSMLEAMATGMPVISLANASSPVLDGVNGFVSNNLAYLCGKIQELLNDQDLAVELGLQARATVQEKFNLKTFLKNWNEAILETAKMFLEQSGISIEEESRGHQQSAMNVLMDYVSYPATTAHYLERALRKESNVFTCGGMVTPEIIKLWNLEALNWEIRPQDIFRNKNGELGEVLKQLPDRWKPDYYLWVENGIDGPPPDLETVSVPKACYLIDTHVHLEQHQELARRFDIVFLAQKEYVSMFQSLGIKNVHWLPLACDPEIHGKVDSEKIFEVGFVGSITAGHIRRKQLLQDISKKFDLFIDRKFMRDMAHIFSQSRIVFNEAINRDLNMRVFEALCSGSLLVTDEAPGSGLTELFQDGKHLAVYNDSSLLDTIQYYLDHSEERERIAKAGRQEVLTKHTYGHRVLEMNRIISNFLNEFQQGEVESNKPDQYYQNVREDLIPLIPEDAQSILDVGCASGQTGRFLKETRHVFVSGIESNPVVADQARGVLDDVVTGDIESMCIPYQKGSFDCIVFADVLEHLVDPLSVLKKLKPCLKDGGTLVASIPNVQFLGVVNHLIEGNWTYQKEGILDETHLRFFTFKEIKKLIEAAGFEITQIDETLDPQYKNFEGTNQTTLKIGRITINDLTPEEMRQFFVFQYKVCAKLKDSPKPENNPEGEKVLSNDMDVKLSQAKEFESHGNLQKAIEAYNEVHQHNLQSWEALIGLGNCYAKLQKPDSAEKHYIQAIEIKPQTAEGWLGLGILWTHQGNLDSALDAFRKALKQAPKNSKVLCGMAMIHAQKQQYSVAKDCFVQSLDIDPENLSALNGLLSLSYQVSQFDEVEKYFENYIELHPANLNMVFGLAGIYFKQNLIEKARQMLDRILIFEPENEEAQQLLERVTEANLEV